MLSGAVLRLVGPFLIGAVAMSPLLWAAHNNGYGSAMKEYRRQYDRWWTTELLLWQELGLSNQQSAEMAERFEVILQADDKARAEFRAVLRTYRKKAEDGQAAAAEALRRLNEIEDDWTAQPVSPDVVCVRGDRSGCDYTNDSPDSD